MCVWGVGGWGAQGKEAPPSLLSPPPAPHARQPCLLAWFQESVHTLSLPPSLLMQPAPPQNRMSHRPRSHNLLHPPLPAAFVISTEKRHILTNAHCVSTTIWRFVA